MPADMKETSHDPRAKEFNYDPDSIITKAVLGGYKNADYGPDHERKVLKPLCLHKKVTGRKGTFYL